MDSRAIPSSPASHERPVNIRTLFPQRQFGRLWTKALIEFVEETKAIILIISNSVIAALKGKGLGPITIFAKSSNVVEFELGLWFRLHKNKHGDIRGTKDKDFIRINKAIH